VDVSNGAQRTSARRCPPRRGSPHGKGQPAREIPFDQIGRGDRGRVCNGWTAVVGGTLLARNGPRRCYGCAGGRRLRLVMPAARFGYGRPVEEMGCAAARDHRGRQKCCTPYESRSIGFGRFGPHVLRHTMATQLLRGGADPVRFLAVSSGFGDQVSVVSAWWVDEGVMVSLGA
jgi:hypothetical protein